MLKKDVILTGIPRAGTTLGCTLINNLSNSVCLSEPELINQVLHDAENAKDYIKSIEQIFADFRKLITTQRSVLNRVSYDGQPLTNYYTRNSDGLVQPLFQLCQEKVNIQNDSFHLVIKHNAHFLSVLAELVEYDRFSIVVVIRNPISTILSWRSLNLPISIGRLPAAEKFWPSIREIGCSSEDIMVKQVKIYEELCKTILAQRKQVVLLLYEDLIKNISLVEKLFHQNLLCVPTMFNYNKNKDYNFNEVEEILDNLYRYSPSSFELYHYPMQHII